MSQASASDFYHRPLRYQPQNPLRLGLTAHGADDGETTTAEASLIDISQGGIKLSLDSQLELHQAISLTIEAQESGLNLAVPAEVCWVHTTQPDVWTAGCAFVPELPSSTLENFFAAGLLERRAFAREPLKLAARAQWELDPSRFDVELYEASAGGICLRSPRSGKVGARLVVYIPSADGAETRIPVRAQWHLALGVDSLVGCAFNNVEGWMALQECLANVEPDADDTARPSQGWARRILGLGSK